MENASQPPAKQRIRNALSQRLPDAQTLAPGNAHSVYNAFVEKFRESTESRTPEEQCAAAHQSGEMFDGGYRGDGQ